MRCRPSLGLPGDSWLPARVCPSLWFSSLLPLAWDFRLEKEPSDLGPCWAACSATFGHEVVPAALEATPAQSSAPPPWLPRECYYQAYKFGGQLESGRGRDEGRREGGRHEGSGCLSHMPPWEFPSLPLPSSLLPSPSLPSPLAVVAPEFSSYFWIRVGEMVQAGPHTAPLRVGTDLPH